MVDASIVIAHMNEDLRWTENLIYPFTIYSVHSIEEETLNNVGREVNAYLRYIIDNYNNLSDYTIFLHGHDTCWHQTEPICTTIKKLKFNKKYFNINVNDRDLVGFVCGSYFRDKSLLDDLVFNNLNIKFNYNISNNYKSKHNAQFYVHKDLIKQYTLDQWKTLYDKLYTYKKCGISCYNLGIVYECMWFFIFTHQYVDQKFETSPISTNMTNDVPRKN